MLKWSSKFYHFIDAYWRLPLYQHLLFLVLWKCRKIILVKRINVISLIFSRKLIIGDVLWHKFEENQNEINARNSKEWKTCWGLIVARNNKWNKKEWFLKDTINKHRYIPVKYYYFYVFRVLLFSSWLLCMNWLNIKTMKTR